MEYEKKNSKSSAIHIDDELNEYLVAELSAKEEQRVDDDAMNAIGEQQVDAIATINSNAALRAANAQSLTMPVADTMTMQATEAKEKQEKIKITFGQFLGDTRKNRKLDISLVAQETKINKQYLLALEQEKFSAIPTTTFLYGYARAYARFLHINESVVIKLLVVAINNNKEYVVTKPTASTINRNNGYGPSIDYSKTQFNLNEHSNKNLFAFGIIVIIILGIMGVVLYQMLQMPTPSNTTAVIEIPQMPAEPPAIPSEETVFPVIDENAEFTISPQQPATDAFTAGIDDINTIGSTEPIIPVAITKKVELILDGEHWVQILEKNNNLVISQNFYGQQTLTYMVTPPIRITYGNAASVRLWYDGKFIDTRQYNKRNVVRITLGKL